eukprot:1410465-Amphidinium_carterae.1
MLKCCLFAAELPGAAQSPLGIGYDDGHALRSCRKVGDACMLEPRRRIHLGGQPRAASWDSLIDVLNYKSCLHRTQDCVPKRRYTSTKPLSSFPSGARQLRSSLPGFRGILEALVLSVIWGLRVKRITFQGLRLY